MNAAVAPQTLPSQPGIQFTPSGIAITQIVSLPDSIIIKSTNGSENTLVNYKDVFRSVWPGLEIYPSWGINTSFDPTPETPVMLHHSPKTFWTTHLSVYQGLAQSLDELCLTPPQILLFVRDHFRWLYRDSLDNYLLIKNDGQYFVVTLQVNANGAITPHITPLTIELKCYCSQVGSRFVFPQLL